LTWQALACELNVSYGSFGHAFQQHIGTSTHKYLLELRLAVPCNLLTQITHSAKEISPPTGFNDARFFAAL